MDFYPLEKIEKLHDGYSKTFVVNKTKLLLCHINNTSYVFENRCPHMDAPLDNAPVFLTDKSGIEGTCKDDKPKACEARLRCPVHGIEFELESGAALGPLASMLEGLTQFECSVQNDEVGVLLP